MEIIIDKSKTYEYAMALTAQAGKSYGDMDAISITPDNYPLLDVYFSNAIATVEAIFRKHLSGSNQFNIKHEGESVKIHLEDGLRPNTGTRNLTESCIRLSIGMHIAGLWLQNTSARDQSQVYLDDSRNQAIAALSAFTIRSFVEIKDEDYKGSIIDTAMTGGSDAGNAEYQNSKKDEVPVNSCWEHVNVNVCDATGNV